MHPIQEACGRTKDEQVLKYVDVQYIVTTNITRYITVVLMVRQNLYQLTNLYCLSFVSFFVSFLSVTSILHTPKLPVHSFLFHTVFLSS